MNKLIPCLLALTLGSTTLYAASCSSLYPSDKAAFCTCFENNAVDNCTWNASAGHPLPVACQAAAIMTTTHKTLDSLFQGNVTTFCSNPIETKYMRPSDQAHCLADTTQVVSDLYCGIG